MPSSYSLALTCPPDDATSVAPAAAKTVVPRSFNFVSVQSKKGGERNEEELVRHPTKIPNSSNWGKLTEQHFVPFLPHLGHECLAGVYDTREPKSNNKYQQEQEQQ